MAREQVAKTTDGNVQPRFATESPAFIDFGCGRGDSMTFAESLLRNPGVGVDILPERVAECNASGFDVQQGDVVSFQGRNIAPASVAVDLMPELDGLRAFEAACTNMLRAARDFVMIQHLCFDSAEQLLARGEVVSSHTAKSIRIRPRAVDYLHFVTQFGRRLDVVGLAVYGVGEPRTSAIDLAGLSGSLIKPDQREPVFRSIRVIMGRKDINRFHWAVSRIGSGHSLLMLETP